MAAAMRTLLPALLLAGRAAAMLRQELRQKKLGWRTPQVEHPRYPSQFYAGQSLDHFQPADNHTWSQRFFVNTDHLVPGGPVFLSIGGEGPLDVRDVSGGNALVNFAERMGGAVVALEHRFYGRSQPFDSLATEHLPYLTSRQALHDLAQFQRWLTRQRSLEASPWFCVGGSYPGNLAAWYRTEFPGLTKGCWAASAPVQAMEDWPGYGQMVWTAVATSKVGARDDDVPMKLYAGYERMAALIQDSTPEAGQWLRTELNVCPGTLVSQQDRDSLESGLSTAVSTVMQYNNSKDLHLESIQDLVRGAETPLRAALEVSKFLNLTVGDGPNNCTDNSIGAMYRGLADTTLPNHGNGNAERTWFWQTCNEFGYFQKATADVERPTMYTRGASSRSMWQQVCADIFGMSANTVGSNIQRTNDYYGAKAPRDISHVLFSNGNLDAWSLLSITSYPENDHEVYTRVANLGSHCIGLYAHKDGDVPGAREVREQAFDLFQRWGATAGIQKASPIYA